MAEIDRFRCKNDPLEDCVNDLKWPEEAKKFGPDAWVYSEMAARSMVHEAYKKGLADGQLQAKEE